MSCTCPESTPRRPSPRQWLDNGTCATCGQRPTESQLTPVLLQILCGGTGLVLERNNIGFDNGVRADGSQKSIHYGVGGKGGGDFIGRYRGLYVEVELKQRRGVHADDQRKREVYVTSTGGIYAVVRNETQARALLTRLKDLAQ